MMQTTIPAKTSEDRYVALAGRCYVSLENLTATMDPKSEEMLAPAMMDFWRRLAWADLKLVQSERDVFTLLFPEADPAEMANREDDVELVAYLRRVAAFDTISDAPIGRKVASQLESFGYALLAADRDFNDGELEVLQRLMRRTRSILFPAA